MATYNVRQKRDPLLDQTTQAMLERRGHELLGMILLALAGGFGLLLGTWSPEDPGWMVATDEPVRNALGRLGAATASTLFMIGGQGAWGIPVILAAWGLRFVLHAGQDRVVARSVFALFALMTGSVFAATHVPPADWPHPAVGLGGLFGDTVLGALLVLVPYAGGLGLKLMSLALGIGMVAAFLFVTGFARSELRAALRYGLNSVVVTYATALDGGRAAAGGALRAAAAVQARQAAARAAAPAVAASARPTPAADPAASRPALRAERPAAAAVEDGAEAAARPGLLSRVPGLIRRAAAPEPDPGSEAGPEVAEGDDRIRAAISEAIRSRVRGQPLVQSGAALTPLQAAVAARREPPMHRRAAAAAAAAVAPLVATRTAVSAAPPAPRARIEPPVTAARAPEHAQEDQDDWTDADLPPELVDDTPAFLRHPAPPAGEPKRIVQPPAAKAPAPSKKALAEVQPALRFDDPPAYELPPLSLLANPAKVQRHTPSEEALEENARMLESVLDDYGVKGEIVSVRPGPVVTMYELEPAPGLKASRVIGLADDIARSMSALSARVSTVPGRSVIGIELPNAQREKVVLREILSARDFGDTQMRLPLALGKDIGGGPVVANLAKMPHLLIAGTTGSGKSVAINTMILSLLYKLTPDECRLIMIDPKMLELSVYDGIPHLLSPVVTDPKKAVVALKWVVGEMEERYRRMSRMGVRNIDGYNGRVREALANGEMFRRTIQTGFDDDTGEPVFETEEFEPRTLPYIVVIVDEMADLMMVAGKEIEACIQRLAQMARASGIHLIMATQRPSVDVITGTIKANFPTRISFQVTSKIDSRTILGEQGAEQLLGMGDMLYMAGGAKITRIHGPFVSDEEVEEIVNHLKSFGPPQYMSGVVDGPEEERADDIDQVLGLSGDASDESLYDQAVAIVAKDRKCSTSYIQRKLGIGYNKAARLVEQMEEQGVVTRANHVGKREILVPEA
jgi:S-DNA-T family DNA segregation ATPase FtsK/SpoIIIE